MFSFPLSGLRPNPNDTDIYAEVTFPWLTLISNFEANVKLLSLLQYPTSGYLSATSSKYLRIEQNQMFLDPNHFYSTVKVCF